jgi:hypothetical protein
LLFSDDYTKQKGAAGVQTHNAVAVIRYNILYRDSETKIKDNAEIKWQNAEILKTLKIHK